MWIAYGKNYVGYSANYVVYNGSTPPAAPTDLTAQRRLEQPDQPDLD